MHEIEQLLGLSKYAVDVLHIHCEVRVDVEDIQYKFTITFTPDTTVVYDSWDRETKFSGFNKNAAIAYIDGRIKAYKRVIKKGKKLQEEAEQMANILHSISCHAHKNERPPRVEGFTRTSDPEIMQCWLGLTDTDNQYDSRGWVALHNKATNHFYLDYATGQTIARDAWCRAGVLLERLGEIDKFAKILHDPRIFREKEDAKDQKRKKKRKAGH